MTSDPSLLAEISEQALGGGVGGTKLGPVSQSISVDEKLSPLGIPGLRSVQHGMRIRFWGGEGHSCEDENQK